MASTLRALRPIYVGNSRPSRSTIERIVEQFESTGTIQNVAVPVGQRSARTVENIAAAEASVEESPNMSLTRRSQALGISETSLRRILRNDPGLHLYKINFVQKFLHFEGLQTGNQEPRYDGIDILIYVRKNRAKNCEDTFFYNFLKFYDFKIF